MRIKFIGGILFAAISTTSCVSNTPPICFNKAHIARADYEIPVFAIKDRYKSREYLSGSHFGYQWIERESFTDTKQCDNIK